MNKDDLAIFKLSNFKSKSEYSIDSFLISNNERDPFEEYLSFKHPFTHDGILIGICLRGKINIRINFKEYILDQNSIIIISPGSVLEVLDEPKDYYIDTLIFDEEFIVDLPMPKNVELLKNVKLNPVIKVSDDDIKNLFLYHAFIIEVFNKRKKSTFLSDMIKGLLYSLLMELANIYQKTASPERLNKGRYDDITDRFVKLLFENFRTERSATYYANRLFITPKHLSHVLKETTGKTVNAWIDEAVTVGAKSLLKSTNKTVLEISEDLDFPTASYFGRYFKRQTGMTPLEYRAS